MKKILIPAFFMLFIITGFLYSAVQVVEIYVCEEEHMLAELKAKVSVSRKELTRVSYCSCQGVHQSLKTEVKDKTTCEPPGNLIYACVCIGTPGY